ncbi:3' terminal RNA ribose 2'-O-methyltransferase Hen1 [Actinopolymorpha sp. B17G11]|uniref:3' terminal RNA ribose 2'-O-methyltransferase Hen1 n=1 Tax=Actinopolymorpha sp. B17G11 TaxID=3160861 RepID=UPI0032E497B4
MLLTLTTTAEPATDLGYLLHKHPGRAQEFAVAGGTAHVFYPEASAARCTVALLLEVDPIGLVRGRQSRFRDAFALGQYVNDRPYVASSMLAVSLGKVFRTALSGRCDARPELAATALRLEVRIPVLPCRGDPDLAERLFAPLGWHVQADRIMLDEAIPDWGASRYVDLRLVGRLRLADALNHFYVLLPVLDGDKHYWVGADEVEKLVRAGSGWLATHPDKALITHRYLAHQAGLTHSALARLAEVDDVEPAELDNAVPSSTGTAGADRADGPDGADTAAGEPDRLVPLSEQRRAAVLAVLRDVGAKRVGDLGCGEGALVAAMLADPSFTDVLATDVSARALEVAARKLRLEQMPEVKRERLTLFQSSLTYRDDRLTGLDAAVLMEVVEHVDPPRLAALERSVLGHAAPATVIVTTPNAEHNVRYESLPAGVFRHRDHRFEWTREEFAAWAEQAAGRFGYTVRLLPVGADDPEVGPPTQLAVFTRQISGESDRGGARP